MFNKILGKNKSQRDGDSAHQEIVEKIAKMNLSDMRVYVNGKLNDFPLCEDGLSEVMRRIVSQNPSTKQRFIELDAMDTKKKKAFDLVIKISTSKKITVTTAELIQEFNAFYADVISKFDRDNKEIYASRLTKSSQTALLSLAEMTTLKRKMQILGD